MRLLLTLSMVLAMVTFGACQCGGGEDGPDGGNLDSGSGGNGGDGGRDGGGGGGGADGGDAGTFDRDASCASAGSAATLRKQPVDVIFVIDNSRSMTSEIQAVEQNINVNFANIIQDAGLDYRVIMLATHGTASVDQSICISAPLSGLASCSPVPARPVNSSRFFHYSIEIGSTNSFNQVINTYNAPCVAATCPLDAGQRGWSEWLRPEATKTFIEITDDNNTTTPYDTSPKFDTALRSLNPPMFGDGGARNYRFHAICGVVENNPVTAPWQPTDPLQTTKCTGNGGDSVNPSTEHQREAILTGGLRFPICQYTSFDAVFRAVAQGVISGSTIQCDFDIPQPDGGQTIDLNNMLVEYKPGDGGQVRDFARAPNSGACGAERYYIGPDGGHVFLCPQTCTQVQADPAGNISLLFQCESGACRGLGVSCGPGSPCCVGLQCLTAGGTLCDGTAPCSCTSVIGGREGPGGE